MTKKEDGGPAFPGKYFEYGADKRYPQGMTLRDWFAGQSIAAGWAVQDAYKIADALLVERIRQ